MHTDVDPTYRLILSAKEFRLMGLGLAGKLKDKDDILAAKVLNSDICKQRAAHLRSQVEAAEKSAELAAAEAAAATTGKETV